MLIIAGQYVLNHQASENRRPELLVRIVKVANP